MRFRTSIKNINTFINLTSSLSLLGNVAWLRLDNDQVRFTVIPEKGSQVWAVLAIDSIFDEDYTIQSAIAKNTINLEVPLAALHRALKSAQNAVSANIRLTKKDDIPVLSLTIQAHSALTSSDRLSALGSNSRQALNSTSGGNEANDLLTDDLRPSHGHSRETTIVQNITVKVLAAASVENIHEPCCREPDVHILFPPLAQLKPISERFTKLALTAMKPTGATFSGGVGPRLELAANMHGELRLGIRTEALKIESRWSGLTNPELDPTAADGGEVGVMAHPSTRMKELRGEEAWAVVRVEGRDWGRVLGVGRMGGKVIAGFVHDWAVILYVYLPNETGSDDSVLTYYISSLGE